LRLRIDVRRPLLTRQLQKAIQKDEKAREAQENKEARLAVRKAAQEQLADEKAERTARKLARQQAKEEKKAQQQAEKQKKVQEARLKRKGDDDIQQFDLAESIWMEVQRTPMSISVSNVIDRDPRVYTHCLFPKCETNAPAYPLSMLALSQSSLIVLTAPSTGTGPLK